ncbi:MAG: hypothetical protein IT461_08745 [Planctomycetes bacterium]|nr:hypothetical protein [Planctomycetota bacterium]
MRKSILAMFVVMIAIFAVACGGNKPAGNGGDANAANVAGGGGGCAPAAEDMMAFYKKAGNYYVAKNTSKAGGTETVSGMKMEVTKSDDKGYTMKMTMLEKDMKTTMANTTPTETTTEWPKTGGEAPKCAPKVEIKKEKISVAGKDLECIVTEVAGTKSWSYKGMPVKSQSKGEGYESSMEVVEFKCE